MNNSSFNLITATDSYKFSHWLQFPKNSEAMFSYIESRGGKYKETVMFGLRYIIQNFISKPITQNNINKAEKLCKFQGIPFNKEGWQYILEKYNGYIPVKIKAIPEGSPVNTSTVLATIESTDPKVFWVVGHIEPMLLRLWYPTTVATLAREIKKIIKPYVDETSDNPESLDFKLVDFGARAATSHESAGIAGMSHLVSFCATDTMEGIETVMDTYDTIDFIAGSIPASEHSTITSWGRSNEVDAYSNMIDQFGDENSKYYNPMYACVSDAYDIFNAVNNIWGKQLKDKLLNTTGKLIVRPDSGNPLEMVKFCLESLDNTFGHTINSKGYKVINKCSVIQGDGVGCEEIKEILEYMKQAKYSTDNISFGMGGALHQKDINRDTQKFALKCSAIKLDGQWQNVYKDPITDKGKVSKKGLLDVVYNETEEKYITLTEGKTPEEVDRKSELVLFYENGTTFFTENDSFQNVKIRASV